MSASSIAPAMPAISAKRDPIIFRWILLSCCGFLSILAIAAWWDPSIRWLHLFEALPYVAVIALAARTNRWGYALGVATAVFWTYSAAFVTNFFESGMRALNASIHDWAVSRADQIIAVPGVIFQLSLITACAAALLRTPRQTIADVARVLAAVMGSMVYFALIALFFQPRYLGIFPRLLHPHSPFA